MGEHQGDEVASQPVATPLVRGVSEHLDDEVASQPVATHPVRGVGDHQDLVQVDPLNLVYERRPEDSKSWREVGTQEDPLLSQLKGPTANLVNVVARLVLR